MVEVKDEILEGEPLYRIRDRDGNIILDNVTIEMITKVVQEPTPVGLKLFSRIEDNNNLVKTYNVPTITKRNDSYNYLALSNETLEYTKGMRVFIELHQEYEDFEGDIIPILSGHGESSAINGMYSYTTNSGSNYLPFDGDDNTYTERYPVGIVIPQTIKPSKIKMTFSRNSEASSTAENKISIGLTNDISANSSSYGLVNNITANSSVQTVEYDVTSNAYYTMLYASNSIYNRIHTLQITAGSIGKFCPGLNSYININNLGNKLINGSMSIGKKYELVYDGTLFNAREVA